MRPLVAAVFLALLVACGNSGSSSTSATSSTPTTQFTGPLTLGTGAAPWPAPDHPVERALAAGVPVYTSESLFYHVHAHLDVYVDGKPVVVPAGLGISERLRTRYQGQNIASAPRTPCASPCIAALHTHDDSGVLHTEADKHTVNTLGQTFALWGVRFDGTCVGGYCAPQTPIAIYVNGTKVATDPRLIALADRQEIAVVIGTPPATIPDSFG